MFMRTLACLSVVLAVWLGACAGRAPQPVSVVQPHDQYSDCAAIQAEIQANNLRVKQLADEQGLKVAQNVAAGVGGLIIWPLFFAMDLQGTATTEMNALQGRQQYLGTLAQQRCVPQTAPSRRVAR
jgi:hypothetical protein